MTIRSETVTGNFTLYRTARMALIALIVLCFAWEGWLAPLRPGGSLLVLKVVPLLLPALWGCSSATCTRCNGRRC